MWFELVATSSAMISARSQIMKNMVGLRLEEYNRYTDTCKHGMRYQSIVIAKLLIQSM